MNYIAKWIKVASIQRAIPNKSKPYAMNFLMIMVGAPKEASQNHFMSLKETSYGVSLWQETSKP